MSLSGCRISMPGPSPRPAHHHAPPATTAAITTVSSRNLKNTRLIASYGKVKSAGL
jgi:hypothetical protein